ncbi:MAG: histidine kinase [bacterium]|nr:hypothetical protein [Gammaproteobacteria bacterium]HIL97864.1 hypothetical protein [Pseudomonadales bacterium]
MADFLVVVSHYCVCYLHILLAWRFYPMRNESYVSYFFWIYVLCWSVMHALYGTELLWEAMGWFTPFYFVAVFVSYNIKIFFVALFIPLLIGELTVLPENTNPIASALKSVSGNARTLFYLALLACVGYSTWMITGIFPLEKWRGEYGNPVALFSMVGVGILWLVMYLSGLRPAEAPWKGAGRALWIIFVFWMLAYLHSYYFWEDAEYWSIMPMTQTLAFSFVFCWYRFRLQFMDMILNQSVRILVLITAVAGLGQLISSDFFSIPSTLQYMVLFVYTLISVMTFFGVGSIFERLWTPTRKVLASIHDDLPMRLAKCDDDRTAIRETESFIGSIFHCKTSINGIDDFDAQNVIRLPGEPFVELKLSYIRGWIPWLSEANSWATTAGLYLQSHLQVQQLHDDMIKAEELSTLAARAELDAMRAQIRPHFLFNTLNSIHSFVRDDPDQAELVIEQLSALMRSVLSSPDQDTIELEQEMETVRNYLAIEHARYGERLKYDIQVPSELNTWQVPPFCIQPLVENAVKHAVDGQFEPVSLRVEAVVARSVLSIDVIDDGPGLVATNEGLGLATRNIKERLDRLYGRAASLKLQTNDSGGVTASLCIPQNSNC